MIRKTSIAAASLLLALGLSGCSSIPAADDKAPMPQTRGMQGMDASLHEKWEAEGSDPYKECSPNPEKTAQQQEHPMPDTKGMKDMDPKFHTMDCPQAVPVAADDKATHVHRAPGN